LQEAFTMSDQLHAIPNTNNQPVPHQNALFRGDELRSINGTFQLVLQDADGNLVLKIDDSMGNPNAGLIDRPVWSPYVQDRGASIAVMQDDGNFVVYDDAQPRNALWWTGTNGNNGAYIILQDDGNLVVYASDGLTVLWQSRTSVGEALGVNAA
jgi:bacillolysin